MSDGFHLFVYGTLRSGGSGAMPLLERCTWLRAATIDGTLYDIDGRFPALLLYGAARVQGEIWCCPKDLLRSLDEFEGVAAGLFRRIGVRAAGHACWTYVAGPALARELKPTRRIASGDWLDRGPEPVTR